jgi:hypothetical protein
LLAPDTAQGAIHDAGNAGVERALLLEAAV